MRFPLTATALVAVVAVSATAQAQSWQEYRPEGIGFRIEMPGKPEFETRRTKGGNVGYHAVVGFKDMAFLAIYGAKSERNAAEVEAALDAVVKAVADGSKVLSLKTEMIGAYPARRILYEDKDKDQFESRILILDQRLLQATFVGPAGDPLGRRFLDSLAVVEVPKP